MMKNPDFLIIGAGIVGLTLARELKICHPELNIVVLEKESRPGLHSSGRHSGVLHSGIYYPAGSLKAEVCGQGAVEMAKFCEEHKLPLDRCGKILVTTNEYDGPQLELLIERATANGIKVEELDNQQLRDLEPEAHSVTGKALFIPSTAVGSAAAVMQTIISEVKRLGVDLCCDCEIVQVETEKKKVILGNGDTIDYGHVVNAAGLHADRVAHQFGVGSRYTLLPFKGLYWKLNPDAGFDIRHLLYPVPDLRVPFLGVHTTTSTDGVTYLGPTAVPAFGRENYHGFQGISGKDFIRICGLLSMQFVKGQDGFRRLAWQEGRRYFKPWFTDAARAILPRLEVKHLLPSTKVGIRAQMLDTHTGKMVMDFKVERGPNSTHILNAISPAWTSAFPFARYIYRTFLK